MIHSSHEVTHAVVALTELELNEKVYIHYKGQHTGAAEPKVVCLPGLLSLVWTDLDWED